MLRLMTLEFQISGDERPDLLPLVQSALSNALSSQSDSISPLTAFTSMHAIPPTSTFYWSRSFSIVTISDE